MKKMCVSLHREKPSLESERVKAVNGGCEVCIQDSLIASEATELIQVTVVTSSVKVAKLLCNRTQSKG